MRKLKEAVVTIVMATKYSFLFCWRNSKTETIARILISAVMVIIGYFSIQATGAIINAIQKSDISFKEGISFSNLNRSGLLAPVIFIIATLLLRTILGKLNWFYRDKWERSLHFANQREVNNHKATLDVAMFRSKKYDDMVNQIQELPASWKTRSRFSNEMLSLFTSLISFVLFGASLLWYKPIYAGILVVTAIPMVLTEFQLVSLWWNLSQSLVPQHKKRGVLERSYRSTDAFEQALMFNQMPVLRKEIDINVGGILDSHNKIRRISLRKELFSRSIAVAGLCGVIVHSIWSIVSFGGDIGNFTIIMAASKTFQGNLEEIVSLVADQWSSAKGIILIEEEFFSLKPIIKTDYPVTPRFDMVPKIRFDQVSFKYPGTDQIVLKDISFTVEPGSKVAIVGKSGNGKSTILALLMRHYDPTSGAVYADKINLKNIEPAVWSNVASALTQEYTVLERRIGEEIASSRLDRPIDIEDVSASARFANFDEVIAEDPNGYDSQIGIEFGGREFSGGERQRLALARVHYRGTPILVLDEPDAKLDPESAQKVIDAVFALKDTTVIMITHHVSRAERCDKVILIEKGKIAEEGTHGELISKNGIYASMHSQDKDRLGSIS